MKNIATIILTVLLLSGSAVVLSAQQPPLRIEGNTIAKVEFKGNVNTPEPLIRAQLRSREGSLFSYAKLSKDVKELYYLGFFSDIKVDARLVVGKVILSFIFEEYEKISEIKFQGNKKLDNQDLKDLMTLKAGSVFNRSLLQKNIESILQKYKKQGYINATVKAEVIKKAGTNKAEILLLINEGQKIVIEKISVFGVKQLDPESVKDQIEDTHESSLFRKGIFDQTEFDKDKQRIRMYYLERGFINMKIVEVKKVVRVINPEKDKEKKGLFLEIYIDEGDRYKLAKLSFEGNEVFDTKFIRESVFKVRTGTWFNAVQFQRDHMTLWQEYRSKGYVYANVVPIQQLDATNKTVSVHFKIMENQKAHIESIVIKGNTRTKDYVIAREIRVKEGEVFNSSKIQRSQQRLFNLRYFKDVTPDVEPGSTEGLMKLIFSVKEDRTGLITLGAGYGTVSGFTAYEQISENNLFGMGLRVHQRAEYGQKRKSVQLGLDTPYIFKYNPTSLGFSISYNINQIENIDDDYIATNQVGTIDDPHFKRRSFDIQMRAGRTLSEYWRAYGSYTWAWIDSYDANFNVRTNYDGLDDSTIDNIKDLQDALERGFTTKSSLRLGLIFDTRDYVGGPSRGVYWSQFFTYTGGIIGGESDYIQSDSNFQFFVSLPLKLVFAVDLKFGFLFDQFNGKSNIYPGDELSFDGMTELRGWRDYDVDGRSKVSALLELRYPIDRRTFWGVFFYDTGKLWQEYKQINFNLKEYKHSFGFGFRLQLAMLPIRLYFARRFEYDESGNVSWPNGTDFFKGWETVFSVAGIF